MFVNKFASVSFLFLLVTSQGISDLGHACNVYWAASTTVRVMEFNGRTLLSDRNHNIGESIGAIAWDPSLTNLIWSNDVTSVPGTGYAPFLMTMTFEIGLPNMIGSMQGIVTGLSMDWSTGNLYIATSSYIYVMKLRFNENLKSKIIWSDADADAIKDVVVHPARGYVIKRSWLDGSNTTVVVSWVRETLALDVRQDILYVLNQTSIVATDLDGGSLRVISPQWRNITELYMDSTILEVWGDGLVVESSNTLLYVDRITGIAQEVIKNEDGESRDIKVYCPELSGNVTTPCTSSNGGCGKEQICLHTPSGVIKCHSHKFWL